VIAGDRAGRDRHAPKALTDSTDPELPIDRIEPTEPTEVVDDFTPFAVRSIPQA
jgi:hypothetical protein